MISLFQLVARKRVMKKKSIKKTERVLEYELPVKIQPQDSGYFAFCPRWKDCYAQGDTVEETISEINLVAQTLIEIYQEEGMKVPLAITREEFLKL